MTASGFPGAERLDDLAYVGERDTLGVLTVVEGFAEQCREGYERAARVAGLPEAAGLDGVVVLGMGGSGISGDVARALAQPRLNLPFDVVKGYGPLPEWIGRNTLVVAVSYSGETEETIDALAQAHERGARGIVVCAGGSLARMAEEYGMPHVAIPGGTQPRAALGYLAMSVLGVLVRAGLMPEMDEDLAEAVKVLEDVAQRCAHDVPTSDNPAKSLALKVLGKVALIYGGSPLTAVAAHRFKSDINEYAKAPAFWNVLPEANHNEICSWESLAETTARAFLVVLLRDAGEHERVQRRFEATRDVLADAGVEIVEVSSEGHVPLARLLSLILKTQLAAIYAGLAYGVDPGPVEAIQRVKSALEER